MLGVQEGYATKLEAPYKNTGAHPVQQKEQLNQPPKCTKPKQPPAKRKQTHYALK